MRKSNSNVFFLVGTRKQIQNLPDSIRISWWRIYYHFSYFAGINNIGNTDNQTNSQQHYLLTFFFERRFLFSILGFFSLLCSSWLWIWSVGVNKVSENIIHFEWMNEWKVKRKLKKVKKIIFCDYDDDHHPTTTTTKTWENFFPIHIFRIQKKRKFNCILGLLFCLKFCDMVPWLSLILEHPRCCC